MCAWHLTSNENFFISLNFQLIFSLRYSSYSNNVFHFTFQLILLQGQSCGHCNVPEYLVDDWYVRDAIGFLVGPPLGLLYGIYNGTIAFVCILSQVSFFSHPRHCTSLPWPHFFSLIHVFCLLVLAAEKSFWYWIEITSFSVKLGCLTAETYI